MKPSPIRFLVSRHTCACRPQSAAVQARPFLSIHRNASFTAPPPSYAGGESLKRRYQAKPAAEDGDTKVAQAQSLKRMRWSVGGIALCAAAMYVTIRAYDVPAADIAKDRKKENKSGNVTHNDGPSPPPAPDTVLEQAELVPTGTTSVPFFPRLIQLSSPTATQTPKTNPNPSLSAGTTISSTTSNIEYQLLGLGIRTVSFLGIQVYVVGLYVATPDIAKLQERLIRTIDPVATTLVPHEKDRLREVLSDPVKGEEIWNSLLKDGQIRTVFRIVPTRNTDFMHMRDGFVRGVTARAGSSLIVQDQSFDPTGNFGKSLNEFKAVFGGGSRKKLPFGQTLLLERGSEGALRVVFEDQQGGVREVMGEVGDERVGRLLWLNYLAGKNVSSEEARRSVVEGCVEWTGRPVGTVATQVV